MNTVPVKHLRERAREGLQKEDMRAATRKVVDLLDNGKRKASQELEQWEEWRSQGKKIRQHVIENLDYYLSQFIENARKSGTNVHLAPKAADAVNVIKNICLQHNAKLVVKSKSMVTEEIHLNKALLQEGIQVQETDLAEYIIQLADEPPSHIIVPSMHKNRYQIAELFAQEAGHDLDTDTPTLTAFARNELRNKFLQADIGITGCNFAIAESGSITLVTNEGNARMCTTYPKVHIAVMGMERIVPTFEDFEVLLSLLPRSATGQKITSYVSIINGPRREGELDGAEEFYLVIVDNNRSKILADQEFRQALRCTRCGACFNVCPVYRQIGGHAYGSVYGGPIGSVITPILEEDYKFWGELPFASTLCGACTMACPVQIPLHDLLIKLRNKRVSKGFTPQTEKTTFKLWRRFYQTSGSYRFAMKSAYYLQKPLVRSGYIKFGPPPLSAWTNSRYFPSIANKSFKEDWLARNKGGKKID
ncbi:MAG: LutB/LldF family L-lactate oxidation iron-sulfur protein [Peptococcales bacterium]|jgi:L-lactate dehydrogenase complex protein LldF